MAATPVPVFVAAACLLAALGMASANAAPSRVSFVVSDETDPQEIAEDTNVFVNGALVAHFALDSAHPADSITVSIPFAPRYDYALCGHITLRDANGVTSIHQVGTGATLTDLGGRAFQLLAASDFTVFYMSDMMAAAPEVPHDVHISGLCSVPTS
jgi:hypothetical protein